MLSMVSITIEQPSQLLQLGTPVVSAKKKKKKKIQEISMVPDLTRTYKLQTSSMYFFEKLESDIAKMLIVARITSKRHLFPNAFFLS